MPLLEHGWSTKGKRLLVKYDDCDGGPQPLSDRIRL